MQYSNTAKLLVFLRVFLGCCNYAFVFTGLRFVPISKGVLIASLAPLFSWITAAIFLKEKITNLSIALTLSSIFGVYLMTLNKQDKTVDKSYELFGYFMVLGSALAYGTLFVVVRGLALHGVNLLIAPLYLGFGGIALWTFLYLFVPGQINFDKYHPQDMWLFVVFAVGQIWGQFFLMRANKYWSASKMAPITYFENVITLLIDILVFKYQFVITDIIGMLIIVVCLMTPVAMDIMKESK